MKDYKYIKVKNKFYKRVYSTRPHHNRCDVCDLDSKCISGDIYGCQAYNYKPGNTACSFKEVLELPVGAVIWSYDENMAMIFKSAVVQNSQCRHCLFGIASRAGVCDVPYELNCGNVNGIHFEHHKPHRNTEQLLAMGKGHNQSKAFRRYSVYDCIYVGLDKSDGADSTVNDFEQAMKDTQETLQQTHKKALNTAFFKLGGKIYEECKDCATCRDCVAVHSVSLCKILKGVRKKCGTCGTVIFKQVNTLLPGTVLYDYDTGRYLIVMKDTDRGQRVTCFPVCVAANADGSCTTGKKFNCANIHFAMYTQEQPKIKDPAYYVIKDGDKYFTGVYGEQPMHLAQIHFARIFDDITVAHRMLTVYKTDNKKYTGAIRTITISEID